MTTIHHIRLVLDRLEAMGWPAWKMELAYEAMSHRRDLERLVRTEV